jgi:hypothetical protein
MVSSSQQRHDVYAEIVSPVETFTWNVDATVTARRHRRANTLRMIAVGSFFSAIALVGVLHHARIIAFGPIASAAYVQGAQR